MNYDSTLLYCRSCKHRINAETERCPQCGAEDPFYFVKARKVKKGQIWRVLLTSLISFAITEYIDPKTILLSVVCFMAINLVLFAIFESAVTFVLREDKKKYSEEFKKICDETNDEVAFNAWSSKMDIIIG